MLQQSFLISYLYFLPSGKNFWRKQFGCKGKHIRKKYIKSLHRPVILPAAKSASPQASRHDEYTII